MIGILLAGGSGTRLSPITSVVNKHILPILDRPMIFFPLQTLVDSGIKDVTVVYGPPFGEQIKTILKHFPQISKVNLQFIQQDRPLGMAHGIQLCVQQAANQSIMVIAGDNIYGKDYKKEVNNFKKGARSFIRQVKDPQRFGVPVYKNQRLIKIEEKPKKPQSNWAVTGPHFFDHSVFEEISQLKPSTRGELEITDLNNNYIKKGLFKLVKRKDMWIDAGTFESLYLASSKIMRRNKHL